MAPEILPCWALNQLLAAITVKDVYNEGKGKFQTFFKENTMKLEQVMRRRDVGYGRQ